VLHFGRLLPSWQTLDLSEKLSRDTNTLADFATPLVTKEKSFITLGEKKCLLGRGADLVNVFSL
jgi:hypothetical protein